MKGRARNSESDRGGERAWTIPPRRLQQDLPLRALYFTAVAAGFIGILPDGAAWKFYGLLFGTTCIWCHSRRVETVSGGVPRLGLLCLLSYAFMALALLSGNGIRDFIGGPFLGLMGVTLLVLLFRYRTETDLALLGLIVLMLFVVGAANQSAAFPAAFIVGTAALCVSWTRQMGLQDSARAPSWRFKTAVVILTAGVSIALFLVFPRQFFRPIGNRDPGGPSPHQASEPISMVGIDPTRNSLSLTNLQELLLNDSIVLKLNVQFRGGNQYRVAAPLFLRGDILDVYADGIWKNQAPATEILYDNQDGRDDDWITVRRARRRRGFVEAVQHIRMAPMGDLCFSIPNPVRVEQRAIRFDPRGVLSFLEPRNSETEYLVISQIPPSGGAWPLRDLRPAPPPPGLSVNLQVPDRFRQFLVEADLAMSPDTPPWIQVQTIREFLVLEYSYSLEAFQPSAGSDPILHFLEEKQTGYCVHFASALALLCRAAGLPTRIATGFLVDGPPGPEGLYNVRQYHAHAWTEVFFPVYGWVQFDATPASGMAAAQQDVSQTTTPLETGQSRLSQLFQSYDFEKQTRWFSGHLKRARAVADLIRSVVTHPGVIVGALAAAGLGVAVYRRMPASRQRRLRQWLRPRRAGSAVPFYRDFLWIMSRRGFGKAESQTGREFLRELCVSGVLSSEDMTWFMNRFYAVRYGHRTLSPEETDRMKAFLDRLEVSDSGSGSEGGRKRGGGASG